MSKTTTAYEATVPFMSKTPVMVARAGILRPKTIKFTERARGGFNGRTAATFKNSAAIEDCDFTEAEAWDRFIQQIEVTIADAAEALTVLRAQLASAKSQAG